MNEVIGSAPPTPSDRLAGLLAEPLRDLGSADPVFDASLAAHATFGKLGSHLWSERQPADSEVQRITAFCLRTITPVSGEPA
ncbi:hypothetical protein ACQPZ8_18435 [Actinomadura nitritigenes]|uniref:hypothetical protein n=1 Tax=Actinomadura nitritigenes TaxID=134602 RepID=UPI003D8BC3D4